MTPVRLSHAELAEHLARTGAGFNAAEVHGLASGLLASDIANGARLVHEVLPQIPADDLPAAECRTALQRLVADTESDLTDDAFHFSPLLPDDSAPLQERVAALREWSEGFLYGLGVGSGPAVEIPPNVAEALEDIGELTRLDIAEIGKTEAEEQAFTELVEFLRVATMLIRDELNPHISTRPSADG